MSTAKDIVATIGTYTDRHGQTKYVSRKVGSLLETSKGPRIKLDASFNPAGCKRDEDGGVWLAIFDQRPRDGDRQDAPRSEPRPSGGTGPVEHAVDDFDTDLIPFVTNRGIY